AHAVARDIDHVVDAAGDPVVSVLVSARAVARAVLAGELAEIGLEEPRVVAIDGAHLARPGVGDDQRAFAGAFERFAGGRIDDLRLHPEHREAGAAGLERVRAGHRGDHVPAGLGLPPGVDDRAAAIADHAVVPFPGFRIDRLAHAAEQAQALAAGLLHPLVTLAHQRAQRGGGGVEDFDPVL